MLYGILLTPETASELTAATGISGRSLGEMQLAHYDGGPLNLGDLRRNGEPGLGRLGHREWVLLRSSRACSSCLAEAPVWKLWWKLGIAGVCPIHRTVLLDTCRTCGSPYRSGHRTRPAPLSSRLATAGHLCNNRHAGEACAAVIDATTRLATPGELAAQVRVLAASEARTSIMLGVHVARADWFRHLRSLVGLLRLADRRAGSQPTNKSHQRRPESAEEATVLIAATVAAFDAAELPARLEALPERFDLVHGLVASGLPTDRVDAWAKVSVHPSPGSVRGRVLLRRPTEVGLRHIPQAVPDVMYNLHVRPLLTSTRSSTGRVFAAVAVTRLTCSSTWDRTGDLLGLSTQRVRRLVNAMQRRIVDHEAFWLGIGQLAAALAKDGIDYQRRRNVIGKLSAVPPDTWTAMSREHGLIATQSRARSAAAWLWCDVALGDLRSAPMLTNADVAMDSSIEHYRRFAHVAPEALLLQLRTWGSKEIEEAAA